MELKRCPKCKESKIIELFCNNKRTKDGKSTYCKLCQSISDKIYKSSRKEQTQEYDLNYRIKNPNIKKELSKIFREKNPNYQNEWRKNKRKTDPIFKIKVNIRSRIYIALNGGNKSKKTLDILGCEIEYFKKYLEDQFFPEMSWENYGLIWEIDHIIPCVRFNLKNEDELLKCFHFSNHQPLFITTDIAKSFGYNDIIGNRNKYKN